MEIRKKIDFLKTNKLSIFYKFLKLIVLFITMFGICNVSLFNMFNPFGLSYLFSLIWCGYNPIIVSLIFALSAYMTQSTLISLKIGIFTLFIGIILYIISKFKKLNFRFGLPYILLTISLIPFVWLNLADGKTNFLICVSCIFSIFFLYICKYFFNGTLKRGFTLRLNPDERICGAIILTLFAFGLSRVSYFDIDWATTLFCIVLLFSTYTFDMVTTISISLVFGFGVALGTYNPLNIALYLTMSVLSYGFKNTIKIFSAISIFLVYLFFTLYFSEHYIFDTSTVIALFTACILFLIVPNKLIYYIKDVFAGFKSKIAVRNVVKTSRDKISRNLMDISRVFKEMEFSFKRTLQKTLPLCEKKDLIKQDIVERVCKDCPNQLKCMRINGDYTTKIFDSLVDAGVNRGQVSETDLNNYIYSRCPKVPYLIVSANEIIKSYREYNILSNNMDCSKILVAEQFKGVSMLLQGMSQRVSEEVNFDTDLEIRICEDLLYKNIFVDEVVVYDKGVRDWDITILVKNEKIDRKIIEKVVSKVLKCKVVVDSIEPSDIPNVSSVSLSCSPTFDVVFGSATCNKAGTIVSGDTHSFIKIDNGKYMMALSDGMGSGSKARETSDLSINLIENYYKAGFDNGLILSSVNKLLSLNNDESFSAVDICILDFFANTMDFIKLATPHSYIKSKRGVESIVSSGLPIGILEEIKPHVTKKYINNFDTIILISDGVADAFCRDNLQNFINNINLINPQEIASSIITKAKALANNVCEDDMTVLVARIFPTR